MQTQVVLISLLILAGATTSASAQDSAAAPPNAVPPAAAAAASGPGFTLSDEIPSPRGFTDAYLLDEIKLGGEVLSEEDQLARWQAELDAGRARAGTLLGAYHAYRALTPEDCLAARAPLIKADQLGSDQAAWQLAKLAGNDTCGPVDRAERERWLKQAVALDYPSAVLELINLNADTTNATERLNRYIYARVAAGYWESTQTPPRAPFDPQSLKDMEAALTVAEKGRAEGESASILQQMLKRHERFGVVAPVEFARGDAGAKGSWVASQVDYRHECQWNLKGNCRGAQRLVFVDLANKNTAFLACKLEMHPKDFVTGAPVKATLSREVLIGPGAQRRLMLGDVNGDADRKSLTVACTAMPKLAADLAAGKCRARLSGSIDVERFYPESAKSRGVEGSAVVRYYLPPGAESPTDAEIQTSSGDIALDDAAIATVRSGKFTHDCQYGLSSIRIAFKLN
ncbi:MAG TPA: energy transducer TonB [Steroidobacteraceae bacterium]|nr:energy transducer TonB [Steroidobacteraceae bacterium]